MQPEKEILLPEDFAKLLHAQPQIRLAFEQMKPACQRGYADWIAQAQDQTARTRRIERALSKINRWGERHAPADQPQVGSIPSP